MPMRFCALLASAASVALIAFAPRATRALDPVPSLDLRGFRAPIDPASGVYLEPAIVPSTGAWSAGLWFSYAYRPVVLRDAVTGQAAFDVIRHQLTSDVVASVGLWQRVQVGFDLPILLVQAGDTPTPNVNATTGGYLLPAQAFGDLRIQGKLNLVRPTGGDRNGFALALDERLGIPTGDQASFMGEGRVTSESRVLGEYRLRGAGIHGALGFKTRGHRIDFACNLVGLANCKSRFGSELPFGLGLSVPLAAFGIDSKGQMIGYLELHGHLPLTPLLPFTSTPAASLQIDAAARFVVATDVSLLAGVGTSLLGGVGDAPLHGSLALSWAPRSHDRDHDGVPDALDRCPELPEDQDGFQDEDGCPEVDNDHDTLPDAADRCPNAPEDHDGYQDGDGCPDVDNDQDKIPDRDDSCPGEPGGPDPDPKNHGCPLRDRDGDRIVDDNDACPDEAGLANPDPKLRGCPITRDSDGDGIADVEDACPSVKGVRSANLKDSGCPDLDPDRDTFIGDEDRCPNEAETWNGYQDDDGCPDRAPPYARPNVAWRPLGAKRPPGVELLTPLLFTATSEVEASSWGTLRAVASVLAMHPEWQAQVGARAMGKGTQADAEARARGVVAILRKLARRDQGAEGVPWEMVKGAPRAASQGIALIVVNFKPPRAVGAVAGAPRVPARAPAP